MTVSWVAVELLSKKVGFLKQYGFSTNWIRYNSIFNFSASVMLFLAFLRRNIRCKTVAKAISIISPLTLGVYLIHDNVWMRDILWFDLLRTNAIQNDAWLLPRFLGVVVVVFAGCLIVDLARSLIFMIFEKRRWYCALLRKIDAIPYKISKTTDRLLHV